MNYIHSLFHFVLHIVILLNEEDCIMMDIKLVIIATLRLLYRYLCFDCLIYNVILLINVKNRNKH